MKSGGNAEEAGMNQKLIPASSQSTKFFRIAHRVCISA